MLVSRNSGSGEFHLALVSYGCGLGDSSDVVSVVSFEVLFECDEELGGFCWAVTAGKLNAGKSLSSNLAVG